MEKINVYFNKFLEVFVKFAETKSITAVKDGFILTIPVTLIGSIFLLIEWVPVEGYAAYMASVFGPNWALPLQQVSGASFGILALLTVLGVSYKYTANEKEDGITCALLALVSFLIVTKGSVITKAGDIINGVIPKDMVGGNGIITALIMALVVAKIFCYFAKSDMGIKMPPGVPDGVVKAFAALLPGCVIFTVAMITYMICNLWAGKTLNELIFSTLQIPLQNFSDTLTGALFLSFLMCLLFWAGVHGPNVVGGVMAPIWLANALANQKLLESGTALVAGENAKIITGQFMDVFIKLGGCGITIGLIIAMLIAAKSAQLKQISKLSLIPGLFNINEPIIFGLPIVFNPYFIIPFIAVPLMGVLVTYFSIFFGFMAPFNAVQIPWTTPPIISGFLLGGWRGIVVQLVIIGASVVMYLPFMKRQDAIFVQEEKESQATDKAA